MALQKVINGFPLHHGFDTTFKIYYPPIIIVSRFVKIFNYFLNDFKLLQV